MGPAPGSGAAAPHPELAVGAVAKRSNELLMVRRGREPGLGRWSVPGGRVELGETLAEAVVRELAEETGLEGVCGPLVGWTEILDTTDGEVIHHFVVLDFDVTILGPQEPTPGDDALEAAWIPVWTVPELDLVDGLAEFLSDHGIIETLA